MGIFLPKSVPYIRLAILSYLRFGLRGADNIAVTIEKSAMRPQAVMARADYLRDGPSFPLTKNSLKCHFCKCIKI